MRKEIDRNKIRLESIYRPFNEGEIMEKIYRKECEIAKACDNLPPLIEEFIKEK